MGFLGRGRGPGLPHRVKGRRRVVAIQSDPHGGHKLGLCNPDTVVKRVDDDGDFMEVPLLALQNVGLTATQERIWKLHGEHVTKAIEIADGDRLDLAQAGDATAGTKHPAGNMPIEPEDQIAIALANLDPWLDYPELGVMRFMSGTAAHVAFGSMTSEALLAGALREQGYNARSLHHSRLDVDGLLYDVAHHGPPPGSRSWLTGNVARYYLRSAVWADRQLGVQPAQWYVRGHYHCYLFETIRELWEGERRDYNIVVIPSLSGMTDFARQVTRSDPKLVNGLVVFEIIDGQCKEPIELLEVTDLRTTEVL